MRLLQLLSLVIVLGSWGGAASAAPDDAAGRNRTVFVPQSRALVGNGTGGEETTAVFSSATGAQRAGEPAVEADEELVETESTATKPRRSKSVAASSSDGLRSRRTVARRSSNGSTIRRAVAPVRRATAPVRRIIRKVLPF
jgi:hypothetical protein